MCKKFYLCVQNNLSIISCPDGLLFDNNQRRCNYPNQVYCNEFTTNVQTTTVTQSKIRKIKKKI